MDHKIEKLGSVMASLAKQTLPTEASKEALLAIQSIQQLADPSENRWVQEDHRQDPDAGPPEPTQVQLLPARDEEPARVNGGDVVINLLSPAAEVPGFHIVHAAETASGHGTAPDLISSGVISLVDAQRYLDAYQYRLDHFLYGILGDVGSSLDIGMLRQTSAILTTAVCAVGALHLASPQFDACYRELLRLAQMQIFSDKSSPDDVRGLIIGAFWVSGRSRTLVSAAVHLAVEHGMHRSFFRALRGDLAHYKQARLYYLIYACDHHVSIVYGRPPMTRNCAVIRRAREFLHCEHAKPGDNRLVSQVLRWSLCTEIFEAFGDGDGDDDAQSMTDCDIVTARKFRTAIDNLRAEWIDQFVPSAHVGNYPRKGVNLQCLFVKLYLCSKAFRNKEATVTSDNVEMLAELQEIASTAVSSASSIIQLVILDEEIQSFLNGLPVYFHSMIAFAAVFLLKVSLAPASNPAFTVHFASIRDLMTRLVSTLQRVTASMHNRHILVPITKGLIGTMEGIERAQAVCTSEHVSSNDVNRDDSLLFESGTAWADIEALAPNLLDQSNGQWSWDV